MTSTVDGPNTLGGMVQRRTPGLATQFLVERFVQVAEIIAGNAFYPYQKEFAARIFESVLERQGELITALFCRQGGKTQVVAGCAGALVMLMPHFSAEYPDDDRFCYLDPKNGNIKSYRDGFWVGIFAPKKEQSQIAFRRLQNFYKRREVLELFAEIGVSFESFNGEEIRCSNGSKVRCFTASDQANIDGHTHHLGIMDESQDISDEKASKSIAPMLAACVVGSTEIVDNQGVIRTIQDIVEGEIPIRVPCIDHATARMVEGRVSAFVDSGLQETLTVTLQSGRKITGTLPHPLLRRNRVKPRDLEWVALKDLQVGEHLCLPEYLSPVADPSAVASDLAYWYGAMVGNGSFRVDASPSFSSGEADVVAEILRISKGLGCRVVHEKIRSFYTPGFQQVRFCGTTQRHNPAIDALRAVGLYTKVGTAKHLRDLMHLSLEGTAQLVAGLFDTDGHVLVSKRGGQVVFSQSQEKLCLDLLTLLHRLGIHGTVSSRMSSARVLHGRVIPASAHWLLVIAGKRYVERFNSVVTLRCLSKAKKLREAVAAFQGHKAKVCDDYPGIIWDKIVSIEPAGIQQVYDLTVPEHASFVANGLISHNTMGTLIKIGTANARKSHFYNSIRDNERRRSMGAQRNHFFVPWPIAAQYSTLYEEFIKKEILRYGERSDEFQMSYNGSFLLHRGQAIDEGTFNSRCVTEGPFSVRRINAPRPHMHYVAGIDFGKIHDPTWVTILEVDWDRPREVLQGNDPELGAFTIEIYGKHVCDWLEIQGDDYESQYHQIKAFLRPWSIERLSLDYTGVGQAIGDRIKVLFDHAEVDLVPFSDDSKDEMGRLFLADVATGRITWPGGPDLQTDRLFLAFKAQLLDWEKEYKNSLLVLKHADVRGSHDDAAWSLTLAMRAASKKPFGGEVEETSYVH